MRAVVEALVAEVDSLPAAKPMPAAVEVNMVLPGGRARGRHRARSPQRHGPALHVLQAGAQAPLAGVGACSWLLSAAYPEMAPSAVTIGQAAGSSCRAGPG